MSHDVTSFFGGLAVVDEARVVAEVARAVRGGRIGEVAHDVDRSFRIAGGISG